MDVNWQQVYEFDGFRLEAAERRFLKNGKPVRISSKAFDLLLALVESNGRLIKKGELYNRVWADQFVEEANLTVQMSAIRKALGESKDKPHYINTIKGHGYRFTAHVREMFGSQTDDELIIETASVKRLVIEKEEEISRENLWEQPVIARILSGENRGAKFFKTDQLSIHLSNRKSVLLFVALVVLLLTAGFGGYWLYRNRSQTSVIPAAESRQELTITRISNIGRVAASSISPDGKFIAYKQDGYSGVGTLFVQQIDTSTVRQLLEPASRSITCTNFSPDGSLIYYVVFDERNPYGALYSVPVLGGTPKRIISRLGKCFTLSPDGKRVAFYRGEAENNRTNLLIATIDGNTEQPLLTRSNNEVRFGKGLAWSSDGNLIAVSAVTESNDLIASSTIFGVEVSSGTMKPLATERFFEIGKMSWTADGRNLVFVAKRPRSENQLYLMDYPSGEVRRITNEIGSYINSGLGVTADSGALVADLLERKEEIWSVEASGDADKAVRIKSGTTNGRLGITTLSDGRIAYIAGIGDNLDVWTANEDGTEAKALTTDSFKQKDVIASPDGRFLVFASDRAGNSHIFRMNADDGSEITQLTFGATSDSHPDVSPDGNWVVYASSDGNRTTVWKVPLAGGAKLQLTDYESGMPVFAPDGKVIACVLPSDSPAKFSSIAIVSAEGGQPLKSFQVKPYQAYDYPIHWTPDGKAIAFGNWHNDVFNLWLQPLSGEAPRQLTNFPSGSIWNFAYSRDGRRIFLSRGTTFIDVALIKDFR